MAMIDVRALYAYEPWSVSEDYFDYETNGRDETVFSVGNGYIGMRGSFEEGYSGPAEGSLNGTYLNGFYDSGAIVHGEDGYGFARVRQTMLNVPDAKRIELELDGERFVMTPGNVASFSRRLDFAAGLLERKVVWEAKTGKRVLIEIRRLVSFARPHLAAISYAITPLNFDGQVTIISGINGAVYNQRTKGDPRSGSPLAGPLLERCGSMIEGTLALLQHRTRGTSFDLVTAIDHRISSDVQASVSGREDGQLVEITFELSLKKGQHVVLEKFITYYTSKSHDTSTLIPMALQELGSARSDGFQVLEQSQSSYLERFWRDTDVEVRGDPALQQGIRFNLFQLLQSVGKDGVTSIGAKGVTGEGYEGHYFWDTEIYVHPVFLHTTPEIAKRLLEHRYSMLPAARKRARELAHRGALYAWRTIDGEETSAYFPAGTAQYHINADIAYALKRYITATGDLDFLWEQGAEMLFESARLWMEIGSFHPSGKFCIHTVTGPDEYTALVNNNAYTNLMAREHLEFAVTTVALMKDQEPHRFRALADLLLLTDEEIGSWSRAATQMYIPHDHVRGIVAQDDSFLEKPVWNFDATPKHHRPLMLYYHYLNIYRHQVLKQADVVLAMVLLGERFSLAAKRRSYEYYEPITTHDSSLSCAIHSILATELGKDEEAYRYFQETARIDLDDRHGNTKDGIHAAAMGGSWMGIVMGFAGMREVSGELSFRPSIPRAWEGYRFRVKFKGRVIVVDTRDGEVAYVLESGQPITIRHFGRKVFLQPGAQARISLIPSLEAVIFDLDGVITDTAEYHFVAWKRVAEQLGVPFDRNFNEKLKGIDRMGSLELILHAGGLTLSQAEKERIAAEKNEYYRSLLEGISGDDVLPGIRDLLNALRTAGIRIGLASASKNAVPVLERLGVKDLFDCIVDGNMVEKGKPDPEPFLLAAELLGVPPRNCVGVEDAAAGVASIVAASMTAVAISGEGEMEGAHHEVQSTAELTLNLMKNVILVRAAEAIA